jgi:hypothetical protein
LVDQRSSDSQNRGGDNLGVECHTARHHKRGMRRSSNFELSSCKELVAAPRTATIGICPRATFYPVLSAVRAAVQSSQGQ